MKSRSGRDRARAKTGKPPSPPAPEPPPAARGADVVELSRFRADLGRGRRLRRAEALLDAESPRKAVRALPGDEFYYVLHETGFPEALEILQYATPEQVQTALDFALWDRDLLAVDRAGEWLAHLTEAPPAALAAWARELDVELVALLLRKRAHVHDLTLNGGEPPDDVEGTLYFTPDGFFALDLLGDDEECRVTRLFVDRLYRMDRDWMRRILVGTRAELDAELEEEAYRWRSGRMADLGFADYYEALEVYREIDPASVHAGDAPAPRVRPLADEGDAPFLRVPTGLAERLAGGSPFARAVAAITDRDELANVEAALVTLSNRVLAADRVPPGEDAAALAVLERVVATLDLAVEFLARNDAAEGGRAVRSLPLVRLFQLGVSLTGKIRRLAETLQKKTPFARIAPRVDLFEPEDREVLAACARLRPMFPRSLDSPPAAGERPFAALADLATASAALERAAAAIALVVALGARPETVAPLAAADPGLDTAAIGRALLVRRWLGLPPDFSALPAEAAQKLEQSLKKARESQEGRRDFMNQLLQAAPATAATSSAATAASAVLLRWIEGIAAGVPYAGHDA